MPHTRGIAVSSVYRTAPIDATGPDYLNAVARLETSLTPMELLRALQHIEDEHGRQRPYRNAPRTLDLDLLLYGDQTVALPELQVPHPRIAQRAFVLQPMAELSPRLELPGLGAIDACLRGVRGQRIELVGSLTDTDADADEPGAKP